MTTKLLEVLAPGHVDIWYRLTAPLGQLALAEARALLSADEQEKQEKFRLPQDRRDYAFGHALLRSSLSRYDDTEPRAWTFKTGIHGKPELSHRAGSDARLVFSLSHTRGLVACAIASAAHIGIDVEYADASFDYSLVMTRYFTHHEILQVDRCRPRDRAARFYEIWSLKEAYAKATGRGLCEGVREVGFQIEGDRIHLLTAAGTNPGAWQFVLFAPEPDYRIAAAIARRAAPVWTIRPIVGHQ
jgi:4'-phosphopantetheinyl transferase